MRWLLTAVLLIGLLERIIDTELDDDTTMTNRN
jgi:hypothetical protein